MNRFIVIDGNAILHRAFHALPPLTNKDGELTNAVYGFFSMFLRIIEDAKPTHIAVCFDRPKPTFRKAMYAGYQATRPTMADGLAPQIGMVHDMLTKLGIQIFEIDGYEADDVIGTLSKQAVLGDLNSARNLGEHSVSSETEVIIVSGDRDLLQLVNSHVKMLSPVTGMTNMQLFDEQAVFSKFGISPSQMIDYKALVGDSSDNYPGVSGIGPKTAKELLTRFKTLEHLYEHVSELPEKISMKLATDAEQAALAKKLATIVTDAPVTLNLDPCNMKHFKKTICQHVFEEMGFQSLLKRVETKKEETKPKRPVKHVQQLGLL